MYRSGFKFCVGIFGILDNMKTDYLLRLFNFILQKVLQTECMGPIIIFIKLL